MTKVRAKFTCTSIEDQPEFESKSVTFFPVIEGSEENKSFSNTLLQDRFNYKYPMKQKLLMLLKKE